MRSGLWQWQWWRAVKGNEKPASSLVLSSHLRQRGLPPWTSYFVRYRDVTSDQRGRSHFNWEVTFVWGSLIRQNLNLKVLDYLILLNLLTEKKKVVGISLLIGNASFFCLDPPPWHVSFSLLFRIMLKPKEWCQSFVRIKKFMDTFLTLQILTFWLAAQGKSGH